MSAKKLKKIAVTIGFKADNTPIKKAFYGRSTAQAKSRAEPVSYTHLDVYKRQCVYCARRHAGGILRRQRARPRIPGD